jgi:hypothetical protein
MRTLALAACVLGCAGCLSTRPKPAEALAEQSAATAAAARADLDAGRSSGVRGAATMVYWLSLTDALHPPPINPGTVARTIDSLPTQGVDPDLLRQGQFVSEKMKAAAASLDSMPVVTILFRVPQSRWLESENLSRAAVEQCQMVERLRPELMARYGVEFPPLDVPTLGRQ